MDMVTKKNVLSQDAERIERLIAVLERQANAINRLVQVLEAKQAKGARAPKQRRVVLDKPIEVTPLVEASARRALARIRGR